MINNQSTQTTLFGKQETDFAMHQTCISIFIFKLPELLEFEILNGGISQCPCSISDTSGSTWHNDWHTLGLQEIAQAYRAPHEILAHPLCIMILEGSCNPHMQTDISTGPKWQQVNSPATSSAIHCSKN